jgi:glycosyltransferase involved in cell wall biosynthesis
MIAVRSPRSDVVVVIPAFNEAANIGCVVSGAMTHVARVIVVDDGSTDATASAAESAGAEVVRHPVNIGKGAAVLSGLALAAKDSGIDSFILMDGDGQHLPADLPVFLDDSTASFQFVLGNRMGNSAGMPIVRRATNRLMSSILTGITGQIIPDSQCGFRRIDGSLIPMLQTARSRRFDFVSETLLIMARANIPIQSVPIRTVYGGQRSSIRPIADTIRFLRLIARESGRGRTSPQSADLNVEAPVAH